MPTFTIEELRAVFTRKGQALRKLSKKLYNLRDVIIVLTVSRARRRIKKIIASCDELEYLTKGNELDVGEMRPKN